MIGHAVVYFKIVLLCCCWKEKGGKQQPTLLRNHTQASRLCSQSFGNVNWLTHHPWPTEIVMKKGREFALEIEDLLKSECAQIERLLSGTICKRTP